MKSTITFILTLTTAITSVVYAQTIPAYNAQNLTLQVPIEMMGTVPDSTFLVNDYYTYQVTGMNLMNAPILLPSVQLGFDGRATRNNPFGVIAQFWYGYQTGDVSMLRNLLTESGNAQLDDKNFFDNFSEKSAATSTIDSIWVVAAIALEDGIMVFTKNKTFGIERNFLREINGNYFIEPFSSDTYNRFIQNFTLYLFYSPEAFKRPTNIVVNDSVSIGQKTTFAARLSTTGSYLVIARSADVTKPIIAQVKDNSPVDRNDRSQRVEFPITLSYFLPKGENEVYIIESNYPISFITQRFIDNAQLRTVKVK